MDYTGASTRHQCLINRNGVGETYTLIIQQLTVLPWPWQTQIGAKARPESNRKWQDTDSRERDSSLLRFGAGGNLHSMHQTGEGSRDPF